jgi:hypothetical protein
MWRGSTCEVAAAIGERLRAVHHQVRVLDAGELDGFNGAEAVVLGSSARYTPTRFENRNSSRIQANHQRGYYWRTRIISSSGRKRSPAPPTAIVPVREPPQLAAPE